MAQLCVVEIYASGVLLAGGEEMSLADAEAMARAHTRKWPGRVVRVLQGGRRAAVQTWKDGVRTK